MILTEIAGVAVRNLAEEFSTPTYVYDQAVIERRIADLRAFPVIRYAQKANSNLAILAIMRRHGVKVDAVSAGEIHRALRAGYRPEDITYTADVFSHDALGLVVAKEIPVNCGSPDMIVQLGKMAPGRNVTLRINPGFGHGHSQKTNTGGAHSKHGIWHEQLGECLQLARRHSLVVTGVHMHIGSGADLEHLSQVCGAMRRCAAAIGRELELVSVGGGLPIPYRPTDEPLDVDAYLRMWFDTKMEIEAEVGRQIVLEVEPGRYLVAEAGYLVCEIRAVKKVAQNTFYLLDAGFNHLVRPAMYGAYHPISLCPRDNRPAGLQPVVVGGPLCESGDIFTQREGGFVETRDLPPAAVGDWLVFHCAGAYGFAMSSNYNSFPLPAEVLIDDGRARLIRRRQPYDDLMRGEEVA